MMDFLTQGVLVPLAALVLSALSVSINERRQRRSREHQRRMRLAGARDDVAFLDAWLKAHDLEEWFDAGVGFVLFGLVPASLVRAWAVSLDRGEGGPRTKTATAA
jgi:hypothetical protein